MLEHVILVNAQDQPIGQCEKIEAHKKALLHRAFSVLIFNEKGEMLLHKRHPEKYHSGGLWTNACCGHPRPGEETLSAAQRRTFEELGIQVGLKTAFSFTYKAPFDNGLTEHEFVHVFSTQYAGPFRPHPMEISELKWISLDTLKHSLQESPSLYTAWFLMYGQEKWPEIENACHQFLPS